MLLTEVRIDRPSIAILSSVYSMPAAWQIAASSSLILREASEMSVSPAQNFAKPSPVPGPSIVYLKSGLLSASASATPVEIGSTVDEPETLIEPVTAPPAALSAGALSAAPLSAAALSAAEGAVVAPPPPLHAATNRVAANANAPTRLVDAIVTCDSSKLTDGARAPSTSLSV